MREPDSGGRRKGTRMLPMGIIDEPTKMECDSLSLNLFHPKNGKFYIFWAHDTPDTYATHCNSSGVGDRNGNRGE